MTELYTPERKKALEKRARNASWLSAALLAAALAVSVRLCFGVRTGNADLRLWLCVGLCALAGAAALGAAEYVILPCRRLARHMDRILGEDREEHCGRVLRTGEAVRIPRSISFAQVEVEEEGTAARWKLATALSALPGEGSSLRFAVRGGYIAAMEPSGTPEKKPGGRGQIRRALSLGTRAVLCLLGCTVLWGFVFSHLTEAPAGEKVTLYIHSVRVDSRALGAALERAMPEGIRMVQARPFTYAMMDQQGLESADLYLVSAGDAETYMDWFAPLPEGWRDREDCLVREGVPMGVPADGAGGAFVEYLSPEGSGEDFYLFFGKNSAHSPETGDTAALEIAQAFLRLE